MRDKPTPEDIERNLTQWSQFLDAFDMNILFCERCGALEATTTVYGPNGSHASCHNPACQEGVLAWAADKPATRINGDLSEHAIVEWAGDDASYHTARCSCGKQFGPLAVRPWVEDAADLHLAIMELRAVMRK